MSVLQVPPEEEPMRTFIPDSWWERDVGYRLHLATEGPRYWLPALAQEQHPRKARPINLMNGTTFCATDEGESAYVLAVHEPLAEPKPLSVKILAAGTNALTCEIKGRGWTDQVSIDPAPGGPVKKPLAPVLPCGTTKTGRANLVVG